MKRPEFSLVPQKKSPTAPFKVLNMSNQLLRTALVSTLLLAAGVQLSAADARATPQQIEALRRQRDQAMDKGDFVAAARFGQELNALETSLTPAAAVVAAPSAPASSSFFSAPANAPASAPAGSSSAFTLPTLTPAPGASSFTPPPPSRAFTAPPAPAVATPVPTPAPVTPVVTPAFAAPTPAPFSPLAAAPVATEEPRPAELPPAVVEIRTAEAALSKLEEFRMAESQTARRGTPSPVEPARPSLVPPPSALFTPATPVAPLTFTPTPSVNLTGPDSDPGRRLEDLTRRRAELQAEAERLAKDNVDWEARYNAAKAELARIETENKGRDRLQTIRDEIARLDTDATRLMQEIEASRVEQDRRARELIGRPATSASLASILGRDRPTVPAAGAPTERKGPQFLPVGTSRPTTITSGDGNIVRTGRSGADTVALTRDLDRLGEKKEFILRELDEVQQKSQFAERELAMAQRTGQTADMDRWTKERATLDARFKAANAELSRVEAEFQSKLAAVKGAVTSDDPEMVNPGDKVRLIVAEDDSYNAVYQVKRDGSIAVKNVGKVAAGGKPIGEVEAMIKAALEETQLTKATVTLEFEGKIVKEGPGPGGPSTTDAPIIIYIAGEFITPGPLKIPEGVAPTLITTIIRSGGITPSGDLTRTKLLRIENGQGAVEEVNVAAILSGNIPPTDIALNSGDIIMIPAFAPVVYVTGNVNKPGTLRLFQDETLTAYSAILRAGGFSRFANLKKCTVVRDLGNGEKMQMPLNVKEIQKGMAPDIVLQGRDIVVIPESFFSF
ncbi:MAG: hypothetical protein RL514_2518 [Verrucomicrobiota bacterium]|jgi:protein involved in polysaccharide export with SLBB domain